ncbi:MAG: motility-associated protein [Pseudomonadota bacterium]
MIQILGLITLIILVFGALLGAGEGVAAALPFELLLIGGAAFGTLIVGNSSAVAAEALSGFWKVVRGPNWRQADYLAILVILHTLTRRATMGGLVAIEEDIERPAASPLFQSAPRILADTGVRTLICDTFRLMALDLSDPQRAEAAMTQQIDAHTDQRMRAAQALHTVADALPALGIVAAVIGIIRAMGVIDQSPTVVGGMIAAALLGTFLGVFLAYGVVGPVATRFAQIVDEEDQRLHVVAAVLSAYASGVAPRTAIELGRAAIPDRVRPSADECAHALHAARFAGPSAQKSAHLEARHGS